MGDVEGDKIMSISFCNLCNWKGYSLLDLEIHLKEKHPMSQADQEQLKRHVEKQEAKRNPSKYRYDILDAEFERTMAEIAQYGAVTYGDFNWTKSRLTGDKGPINHIKKHLGKYILGEPYDHSEIGTERKIHLAAIAFNAMMEYWYECHPEIK